MASYGRYGQKPHPTANNITAPRHDSATRITKPGTINNTKSQRSNLSFEDEATRKWVSEEDAFVLKQSKKKAAIRVREGRAKPSDWLAVILRAIDPNVDLLDDDEDQLQVELVYPESVFDGLNEGQFNELEKDIAAYLALETIKTNKDYWQTMQIICKDTREKLRPLGPEGRAISSVSSDVDKLLSPKSYDQLEALEKQIRTKLKSDDDIDIDYWQHLLKSLLVWKARAKLKKIYQAILDNKMDNLRAQRSIEAGLAQEALRGSIQSRVEGHSLSLQATQTHPPDSLLRIPAQYKSLPVVNETPFLESISADRLKVHKLGSVLSKITTTPGSRVAPLSSTVARRIVGNQPPGTQRFSVQANEDSSQATKALFDREAARGVNENEEIFTSEETVTSITPNWADTYRPRKPRYFNRVQMGYEWNKYNQTHYDHDNPPPKVVQGYKFNIFYPDLVDKTKAPTFKIIREGGRRRGESFATAGEDDTCLIHFISGPPYSDIAFRIIDAEWDYSAKHDRGFRSSFDKGILTLHFQFKKIYYRK